MAVSAILMSLISYQSNHSSKNKKRMLSKLASTLSDCTFYARLVAYNAKQVGRYLFSKSDFPESWDYKTGLAVTILRSGLNYKHNSPEKIRSLNKFLFVPLPGSVTLESTSFTYRLDDIIKMERLGAMFRDAALPEIPPEHNPDATVTLDVDWIVPKDNPDTKRCVLFLHGGAYFCGSSKTHRLLACKIAKKTGARVLVINYRLAPDHAFPAPIHDTLASYLFMLDPQNPIFKYESQENAPKHRFSPENIVLMGDSAGGAMSISMLLYLKDYLKSDKEGQLQVPFPSGACVFSPWVDLTCSSESWETNRTTDYLPCPDERSIFYNIFKDLPGNPVQWYVFGKLDEKAIQELTDADHGYASEEELTDLSSIEDFGMKLVKHPLVSPLYGNLAGLPPIMMQAGDGELLRDDTVHFMKKLIESNPGRADSYRYELYAGMPHDFQCMLWLDESHTALLHASIWTKAVTEGKPPSKLHFYDRSLFASTSIKSDLDRGIIQAKTF